MINAPRVCAIFLLVLLFLGHPSTSRAEGNVRDIDRMGPDELRELLRQEPDDLEVQWRVVVRAYRREFVERYGLAEAHEIARPALRRVIALDTTRKHDPYGIWYVIAGQLGLDDEMEMCGKERIRWYLPVLETDVLALSKIRSTFLLLAKHYKSRGDEDRARSCEDYALIFGSDNPGLLFGKAFRHRVCGEYAEWKNALYDAMLYYLAHKKAKGDSYYVTGTWLKGLVVGDRKYLSDHAWKKLEKRLEPVVEPVFERTWMKLPDGVGDDVFLQMCLSELAKRGKPLAEHVEALTGMTFETTSAPRFVPPALLRRAMNKNISPDMGSGEAASTCEEEICPEKSGAQEGSYDDLPISGLQQLVGERPDDEGAHVALVIKLVSPEFRDSQPPEDYYEMLAPEIEWVAHHARRSIVRDPYLGLLDLAMSIRREDEMERLALERVKWYLPDVNRVPGVREQLVLPTLEMLQELYTKQGNHARVAATLKVRLDLCEDDEARFELALAQVKAGDIEAARENFDRTLLLHIAYKRAVGDRHHHSSLWRQSLESADERAYVERIPPTRPGVRNLDVHERDLVDEMSRLPDQEGDDLFVQLCLRELERIHIHQAGLPVRWDDEMFFESALRDLERGDVESARSNLNRALLYHMAFKRAEGNGHYHRLWWVEKLDPQHERHFEELLDVEDRTEFGSAFDRWCSGDRLVQNPKFDDGEGDAFFVRLCLHEIERTDRIRGQRVELPDCILPPEESTPR